MSLVLLEEDGKFPIDDDSRKYLPELPDLVSINAITDVSPDYDQHSECWITCEASVGSCANFAGS